MKIFLVGQNIGVLRWQAFAESAFPLTLEFPKLERHEVKCTLASAGIFGNCSGNTFLLLLLFHPQVTHQVFVHVGARLKCGTIYINMYELVCMGTV